MSESNFALAPISTVASDGVQNEVGLTTDLHLSVNEQNDDTFVVNSGRASGWANFGLAALPAGATPTSVRVRLRAQAVQADDSRLTWEPPDYSEYTTLNVGTTGQLYVLDDSLDYHVVFPNEPVIGPVQFRGGRNIVMIGGEIRIDNVTWDPEPPRANEATQTGIRIHDSANAQAKEANAGRIVHIEGIFIHGYYCSDGIQTAVNYPVRVDLRVQNCRVEGGMWYRDSGDGGSPHPDILQPYGGVDYLRVDKLTGLVTGQGLMIKPDFSLVNPGHMELRRLNLRENTNPATEYNDPNADTPRPEGENYRPRYLWWTNGNEGGVRVDRGTVWFNHPTRNLSNDKVFWPEGNTYGSDNIGQFGNPPHASDWAGTGTPYIYEGDPPVGDYVPVGLAGVDYVSPGYGYVAPPIDPGDPDPPDLPDVGVEVVGSHQNAGFQTHANLVVPAGAQANDLVLCFVATPRWRSPHGDYPPSVEHVGSRLSGTHSEDSHLGVFRGVVGQNGLEAGATLSIGDGESNQNHGGVLVLLRAESGGVPVLAPDDLSGFDSLAHTGNTSPVAPSINLEHAGVLLNIVTAAQTNAITVPSGYTQIAQANRIHANVMAAQKDVEEGTSGTATASLSTSGGWNAGHYLVYD